MKIKFRWPYKDKLTKGSNINFNGQPIGQVTDIESTEDGIIVSGEFSPEFMEGPDYKKLFIEPEMSKGFYSLGPIPANETLPDYSKADAEMTMALYGVHPEYPLDHSWIKPGTRMGCATVILASIGLWMMIYFFLHWIITGEAFPLFRW